MELFTVSPSVPFVKVSLCSFRVTLLDCSALCDRIPPPYLLLSWPLTSVLRGFSSALTEADQWPVHILLFRLQHWHFLLFLFLISSSFCSICPFVTRRRCRLLHQMRRKQCVCVCVWSRSLKRWSFDVASLVVCPDCTCKIKAPLRHNILTGCVSELKYICRNSAKFASPLGGNKCWWCFSCVTMYLQLCDEMRWKIFALVT